MNVRVSVCLRRVQSSVSNAKKGIFCPSSPPPTTRPDWPALSIPHLSRPPAKNASELNKLTNTPFINIQTYRKQTGDPERGEMTDTANPSKRRRLDAHGSHSHSNSQESSSDELGANSDVERRRASWLKQVRTTYQSPRPSAAGAGSGSVGGSAFKPRPTPTTGRRVSKVNNNTATMRDSEDEEGDGGDDGEDSESPDELAVDHHHSHNNSTYWRRQSAVRHGNGNGMRSTSRGSERSERSRSDNRRRRGDEHIGNDNDNDDGEDGEVEDSNSSDDVSEDASDDEFMGDGGKETERPVRPRTPTPPPPPPPPKPERLYYKEKLVLRGHQRGVAAVQFSPDGSMIASCCKHIPTPRVHCDCEADERE